ncbi:MAG: deoxycytidylate deaminase [Candidatus Yanofskybacteria bacterium]|nr:deoxycytidylate deaminase [Candidatus Yanofskybacteria bacterium]
MTASVVVAYVPVLHEGYFQFFERHRDSTSFVILGADLIKESDYLRKEVRALDPQRVPLALKGWFLTPIVTLATPAYLEQLNHRRVSIVMPDEDICHHVAEKYLFNCEVVFDQVFLRWDRKNTLEEHEVQSDRTISITELDREFIGSAFKEAEKSSDWWRQVGGVLVRDKRVLITAHNRHMPSPHTPYVDGDPRNAFHKGVNIELGTVLHAEKGIICEAARRGISTEAARLYVSTFPCPPCAKAIVAAGIKRCYYSSGYAMLDGERILKDSGVEVVYVPF